MFFEREILSLFRFCFLLLFVLDFSGGGREESFGLGWGVDNENWLVFERVEREREGKERGGEGRRTRERKREREREGTAADAVCFPLQLSERSIRRS